MSQPAVRTGADMFGATLLFSLMLHGLLILGIGFSYMRSKPSLPTLDVTLVDVANNNAPDQADFLAQANNQGSGSADKASRPGAAFSGPLPNAANGISQRQVDAATPAPQQATPEKLLTTTGNSRFSVQSDTNKTDHQTDDTAAADEARNHEEQARLEAETRRDKEKYAKRPHKVYIDSANTREVAYAAYMHGWTKRIERVGNLNYPKQASTRGLHGDLLLTVGLDRDGNVKSIELVRSSGQKVLDDAATSIVRLASPFPALPKDAKERGDELYITRTWVFGPNDTLETR